MRAGDDAEPFAVSDAQGDWLRRQLLEKHMTDSIYHGLAIGLSLLSSVAPGTRISTWTSVARSATSAARAGTTRTRCRSRASATSISSSTWS